MQKAHLSATIIKEGWLLQKSFVVTLEGIHLYSSFYIWIGNFCLTLQSISTNSDLFRYTMHEKNLIRIDYFGNRKILLN